jgi:antitoxin component of MazEF toxin-antitoxin module
MVRTITRHGNGSALPLDRTILEQLGMKVGDQVQVTVSNGSLVVTPMQGVISEKQFEQSQKKMLKRYQTTLKHLAE